MTLHDLILDTLTVYRRSFGQAKHIQVLQRPDTNVIYSDFAVLSMSILSIIIPLF